MKAIKLLLLSLALLLSGGVDWVTATKLPNDRPQVLPYMSCETIEEVKVKVEFCQWGRKTSLPNEINMRELFAILSREYMDDEDRIDLVVMIEPPEFISNQYWGMYLPATGNIIISYPWDDDFAQLDHTIMHEMLHALWDMQGLDFAEHHQRIYCQDVMAPLNEWIAQYDTNPSRTWASMIVIMQTCGGDSPL